MVKNREVDQGRSEQEQEGEQGEQEGNRAGQADQRERQGDEHGGQQRKARNQRPDGGGERGLPDTTAAGERVSGAGQPRPFCGQCSVPTAGDVGDGKPSGLPWRRLSRLVIIALLAGLVLVVVPEVAYAAGGGIGQVQHFASKITHYVTAIAAGIAVLFMAINGVRYTVSSGNPSKQAEAKNGLVSAAIGLAIALSADVLVQLVVSALG